MRQDAVMPWVVYLPNVDAPLLKERAAIDAKLVEVAELYVYAHTLEQEAFQAALRLEVAVRQRWSQGDIDRAKARCDAPSDTDLTVTSARFRLGRITITREARKVLRAAGKTLREFIQRHAACDWSEMNTEEATSNTMALLTSGRIFSAYNVAGGPMIWVITEADREQTTLLLPGEQ